MGEDERMEGWEGLDSTELTLRWSVPSVHLYGTVGSTNDVGRALARSRAPAGTVVLADAQRRGRGRGSRHWMSPRGRGVWLSMVLRPTRLDAPGLLSILVGTRLAERLEGLCGVPLGVKWPNDLMLRDRKLAGILCESSWGGHDVSFVVAGVGVNVRPVAPEASGRRPASLEEAAGGHVSRLDVADIVVEALAAFAIRAPSEASAADLERFHGRDVLAGRTVTVADAGGAATHGDACGIDSAGRLLLRQPPGVLRAVESGSVHDFVQREGHG